METDNPQFSGGSSMVVSDRSLVKHYDITSAVSWSSIVGGTFAAVALSITLLTFGAWVGFATSSFDGASKLSPTQLTCMGAVWLIIVQWLSSGLGGYLTGRLRVKWINVHSHEVFFRDTAHGFLTWCVATVIGTILIFFMASSALSGSAYSLSAFNHEMSGSSHHEVHAQNPADVTSYYTDSLFRADHPVATGPDLRAEVTRIFVRGVKNGRVSEDDKTYLAQVIASQTGISQQEAEKRVDNLIIQAHNDAEEARKAAAELSIYSFLSMLVGAFIASASAALGGKLRDEAPPSEV